MPDTAAAARFYSRIFKTVLHEQPVRDSLRYFVVLGDVPADRQVGYVAIGAAQGRPPAIGHYCVLAKVYDRGAMTLYALRLKIGDGPFFRLLRDQFVRELEVEVVNTHGWSPRCPR